MDCIPYDIQVPKYYALAITIYRNCNLDLAVTTVFSTQPSGYKTWITFFATILWKKETISEKVFQAQKHIQFNNKNTSCMSFLCLSC